MTQGSMLHGYTFSLSGYQCPHNSLHIKYWGNLCLSVVEVCYGKY